MEGVGGDGRGERVKPSRGRGKTPTVSTASARPQRWKPLDQDYEVIEIVNQFLAMYSLITLIYLEFSCIQTGGEGGERDHGLSGRHAGGVAAQGQDGPKGVQGNGLHAADDDAGHVIHRGGLGPRVHAQASARAATNHLSQEGELLIVLI